MSATASYKVKTYPDGSHTVVTSVSWDRSFGKCNNRTFTKTGEIHTRKRFLSWCKRNNVTAKDEVVALLPEKTWHGAT